MKPDIEDMAVRTRINGDGLVFWKAMRLEEESSSFGFTIRIFVGLLMPSEIDEMEDVSSVLEVMKAPGVMVLMSSF